MSELVLLLCLLVAAYVGSILTEGRRIRGFGLPSGAEWLLLGVILGPHVLGVFESSVLLKFEPLVVVGLGWTALVVGIDYGYVGERRIRWRGLLLGLAFPLLCGSAVAAASYFYCSHWLGLGQEQAAMAGLGLALVSSETTRHAVRWVNQRYGASGPLATALAELADADDALPLVMFGVLVAFNTTPDISVPLDLPSRLATSFGLSAALGLIAAALLAKSFAFGESWTVVIGVALLGIGMSMRLEAGALTVLFLAGAVLCRASHRHRELRRLLAPTERPVTLPLLMLGGASLDLASISSGIWGLLLVVLAVRFAAKLVSGGILAVWLPAVRKAPFATGSSLLASGTLAMSIGLSGYLSLPRPLGEWMLLAASLTTLVGELVGPLALQRALRRAGEIADNTAPSSTTAPKLGRGNAA